MSSRNGVTCNFCSTRLKNKSSLPLHLSSIKCQTQRELNRSKAKEVDAEESSPKSSESSSDLFRKVSSTTASVEKHIARMKLKKKSESKGLTPLHSTLNSSSKSQKNFSTSFQHGPAMFRQPQEVVASKRKEQKSKTLSRPLKIESQNEDEEDAEDDHVEVDPDFQDSEEIHERKKKTQVNLDEEEQDTDQTHAEEEEEEEDDSVEKGLRFDEEMEPEGFPTAKPSSAALTDEDKTALLSFWQATYQLYADETVGLNFFTRIKDEVSSYQNTAVSQKVVSEMKRILLSFIEGAHNCIKKFWNSLQTNHLNFFAGIHTGDGTTSEQKEALQAVHQWWKHKHLILGNEHERKTFERWEKIEKELWGNGNPNGVELKTVLHASLALLWLNKKITKIEKTVCFFLKHPMPILKESWKLPFENSEKEQGSDSSLFPQLSSSSFGERR